MPSLLHGYGRITGFLLTFCLFLFVFLVYTEVLYIPVGYSTVVDSFSSQNSFSSSGKLLFVNIDHLQERFQTVGDGNTVAYSAYVDDRVVRDFWPRGAPAVRIFAYLGDHKFPQPKWICILWYRQLDGYYIGKPTLVANITTLNGMEKPWSPAVMILCPLVENNGIGHVPQAVSIVPNGFFETANSTQTAPYAKCPEKVTDIDLQDKKGSYNDDFNALNVSCLLQDSLRFIPIRDLRQSRRHAEDCKSSGLCKIPESGICVPVFYGDKYKWTDVVNFIEINRVLGASRFIFLIKWQNITQSLQKFFSPFLMEFTDRTESVKFDNSKPMMSSTPENIYRQIVEVYDYDAPQSAGTAGIYYHGEILAITECLYRSMYRVQYLAIQDLDELIVPLSTNNWHDMIVKLSQPKSIKKRLESISSMNFRNIFLPLPEQVQKCPLDSSKSSDDSDDSTVYCITQLRVTVADSKIFPYLDRSKVIVAPERILQAHVHFIKNENILSGASLNVDKKDALLYHYRVLPEDVAPTKPIIREEILRFRNLIEKNVKRTQDYFRTRYQL